MTMRKLLLLYQEYKYFYGIEKKQVNANIDDIIPEGV